MVDVIALKIPGQPLRTELNGVNIYHLQERQSLEGSKFTYLYSLLKFFIVSSLFILIKHVKKPYQLIHVHSVPDFQIFSALIPKLLGSKTILDIHDPVPDFFQSKFGYSENHFYIKMLKLTEKISGIFADHVITVTDYWKKAICHRTNISKHKMSVILNLPNINFFDYGKFKNSESDGNFTLIYPGTLNKHCGLDTVIKAIDLVKEEVPNIKLLIYGSGSEENRLITMVNDLGLQKYVHFHGKVSLESIPEILSKADVGIALLSGNDEYSDHALNVKLFEFLAMGLPSIATRAESVLTHLGKDVVLLSETNDPGDVARCILELYSNPEMRTELREKGLDYIRKNNSEPQMSHYIDIVNRLTTDSIDRINDGNAL